MHCQLVKEIECARNVVWAGGGGEGAETLLLMGRLCQTPPQVVLPKYLLLFYTCILSGPGIFFLGGICVIRPSH
jgi:hypothetical protein